MLATTPAPTVRPPSRMAKRKLRIHRDRRDQLHVHRHVVARHHHLGAFRQLHDAGHVGGAEVELRAVVGEERRVPAALFLGQDVRLGLELGVRRDRAGLRQHLAALDVLALGAAQQRADVVAGLALVEQLAEHLDAGHDGLLRGADADDLDFLADLDRCRARRGRSPRCRGRRSRTRLRPASGTAGRSRAPAAGCSCRPPSSAPGWTSRRSPARGLPARTAPSP